MIDLYACAYRPVSTNYWVHLLDSYRTVFQNYTTNLNFLAKLRLIFSLFFVLKTFSF